MFTGADIGWSMAGITDRRRAWVEALPPFKVDMYCVKCGISAEPRVTYHEGSAPDLDYLEWTCPRCGYGHATRCRDASPPAEQALTPPLPRGEG